MRNHFAGQVFKYMKLLKILLLLSVLPFAGCDKNEDDQPDDFMYFPSGNEWDTRSVSRHGLE